MSAGCICGHSYDEHGGGFECFAGNTEAGACPCDKFTPDSRDQSPFARQQTSHSRTRNQAVPGANWSPKASRCQIPKQATLVRAATWVLDIG